MAHVELVYHSSPSGQNLWISRHFCVCVCVLPSGKPTKSYGKSPFLVGKLTISMAIFNSKLLVYQRVIKKCHLPCTWTSQPQTMCLFQCEKSHECTSLCPHFENLEHEKKLS